MPTCDPMSSAAPASDRLRTTQHIDISPYLIKPVSRTRRRLVFRASAKSMTVIWGALIGPVRAPDYDSGLTPLLTAGRHTSPCDLLRISRPLRLGASGRREERALRVLANRHPLSTGFNFSQPIAFN